MAIISKSWILTATTMKPIAAKQDDRMVHANAGVVLQPDDAFELTVEGNNFSLVVSLTSDTAVLCVSEFLSFNCVVTDTINNAS